MGVIPRDSFRPGAVREITNAIIYGDIQETISMHTLPERQFIYGIATIILLVRDKCSEF
jgi:hypothetical protein